MSPEVSLDAGLASLRGRAVVADLTGRGTLVVSGPDCAELLHGLVTNDVKRLRPGSGCHAALLTPKGRMRADLVLLRTADDELVLDCDPSLAASLHAILSGYVPFSRSTLEDRTSASGVVHLEGPASAGILGDSGCSRPPDEPFSHLATDLAGGPVRVVRISRAGEEGFDVRVDRAEAGKVLGLLSTGARPVPPELLDAGRVEAGIPRWGSELDETVLPNEAWLERTAISYQKGCYLGQETVARLKTYGHVNRHLVALLLPLGSAAAPGDEVLAGDAAVGKVTSAVDSALRGRRVALAFVKREHEAPGTTLLVGTRAGAVEGVVAAVPLER